MADFNYLVHIGRMLRQMIRCTGYVRLIVGLALCVTFGWTNLAHSSDLKKNDFRIVTVDDSEVTKRIVDGLQKKFPGAPIFTNPNRRLLKKREGIYIAVGPSALRALLAQNLDGVIVSVFTSGQAYKAILDSMPESRFNAVTAIYAEPAPSDQLRLISLLYKKKVNVAVFVSEKTAYLQPILRQASFQTSMPLAIEHVSADNLNRALNRIGDLPVLLATPDSTIYNGENLRNILVTTYRHHQAVVGFSTALVKAGALASAYSGIDDIIAQVGELLNDFQATGRLPDPQFPKYFSVVINDDVARSLNLVIDDEARNFSRKPDAREQ